MLTSSPLLFLRQRLSADSSGEDCRAIHQGQESGSRKLCQEVGSLARWMEGDSSGSAASCVRRLSECLTSPCSRHDREDGWVSALLLSLSCLSRPAIQEVMFSERAMSSWSIFSFILSFWIQLFFPSHTVPRTSEQLAVTRWSFLAGFSAARKGFIGSRWVWTEGDEPKRARLFFWTL